MKRLIIAAAAAFTLTFAQAQDCKGLGELAEKVMEARQAGVPLSNIRSNADYSDFTKRLAIDAYKQPRFSTQEMQRSAAVDFRTEWELACYEVRSKKKGGSDV